MFVGVLQDLVARDDATLDFIEDHMPPELDEGPAFVPRNGPGMWLKEAEHLLVGGDGSALEHPAARLRDHLLHQGEHRLGLAAQALGLLLGLLAQRLDNACGLPHHVFSRLHELLVQFGV